MRLILASRSPRRAELLQAAGFEFDIVPAEVDERPMLGEEPDAYVARLAEAKAAAVACRFSGSPVLGADTVVVIGGQMLGKPASDVDAAGILRMLSGRTHTVLTALALHAGDRRLLEVESTRVRFLPLSAEEIAWYVATDEPRDKAGAYAVQGRASRFVERIEGSYTNVVGLPVATLCRMLRLLAEGEPVV